MYFVLITEGRGAFEVQCATIDEAMEVASTHRRYSLLGGKRIEIWKGNRRLVYWEWDRGAGRWRRVMESPRDIGYAVTMKSPTFLTDRFAPTRRVPNRRRR